jgi:hypothetical protein
VTAKKNMKQETLNILFAKKEKKTLNLSLQQGVLLSSAHIFLLLEKR